MAQLNPDSKIREIQEFTKKVYEIPNNRHFELGEMLNNIQRFAMRGLKGIRKGDLDKTRKNLIISFFWFMSTLVRLEIDLEEEVWKRFPYLCSYCGTCPCSCKSKKVANRQKPIVNDDLKPTTLNGFQEMFAKIYPASSRNLEHAGVHLAEEIGEFSEAYWAFRSERTENDFQSLVIEAADYFSCLIGVFNSMNSSFADEISKMFYNNCHECHNAPCTCSFERIKKY